MPQWWKDLPRERFGDSAELADNLLALVLSGRKTATCDALAHYPNGPPKIGGRYVMEDGQGRPSCVLEITDVVVRRFDEVDADFARAEGEGDLSYDFWRRAHEAYFRRNGGFAQDMKLVCERFRVVETIAPENQ